MDDNLPTLSDLLWAFACFVMFAGCIIVWGLISMLAGH
jgi:hypothetical protein